MGSRLIPGVLRYLQALAGAAGGGDRRDAELLEEFVARRDEAAFATLLERHGPLVLGVCWQVLGDAHDAEDAFQAVFLVLARRGRSIRRHASLAAWLHRVAVNVSRTAQLASARRRTHEKKAILISSATPVVDEAACDWQPLLHEEVDRLPEKYRVPVVLCYFEGKTHDQAARQLRWPLGTVKGRLARARDLLRTRLARRGVALTVAGLAAALAESATAAVSPALLGATLRAALTFAAGGAGADLAASAVAATLARGALHTSIGTKLLSVVALLLVAGLATFALVAGASPGEQRAATPLPIPQQAAAEPQDREKRPEKEAAPEKRNDKLEKPAPARVAADLHGDPLPPGALARLGTVRFRATYGGTFPAIAFLPGDKTLMTAAGGALSTWDVATGKELRRWDCKGASGAFALAPDGKTLAVGTYTDNPNTVAIYLRDAATGRVLKECCGHSSSVRSLAFAPDGKTLISGSHDKTVRFWDPADGKELRRFTEADMVMAVALSPDGKTLATTSFHSPDAKWTVRLRDAATGQEQRQFKANAPVFRLEFSSDGKTLAALAPHNGGQPTSSIYLLDVASGKLREIAGQPPFMYTVAFSPDGKTLATGSDQGIVLWDVAAAKERVRLGGRYAWTSCLSFSSDGKTLATVGHGAIRLWDVTTGKECPAPAEGHQGGVYALKFLPDGKTLASVGRDMNLRFWEIAASRPGRQHRLPAGGADPGDWFAADGSTFAWRDDKRVAQMDVATGKPLRSFDFPETVFFFAMAPDGKLLAAYSRDRVLRVLDRTTGKVVRAFAKYPDLVSSLAFAPDSRTLAVAVEDNTIRLEDATTGEQRVLLQWPDAPVTFAFSPDGKTLAVALVSNRLLLLDAVAGKEILAIKTPELPAQLVYSPDSKRLAAGTESGAMLLWELATGQEVCQVKGHQGPVSCIAFSADGRRLASGGEDTTILTWDALNLSGDAPAGGKPSDKELAALWTDLTGDDAARAYRALRALVAAPEQSAPFLRQRVSPAAAPDPKRLARLIADLDADAFAVREEASRALEQLGPPARPALRQARDGRLSAEAGQRVDRLLEQLETLALTAGELRTWRAIEVLEHIGTAEARRVLEKLASGAAGARTTEAAKAALERLAQRPSRARSGAD
jgi:RNA polymerase sigma factor (sigma-70 family)